MANFNEGNFLQSVKQIITGTNSGSAADGGFLLDVDVTNRSTLGPIFVTRDYDANSDNFMLRLICSTSTAANPTITAIATLTVYTPGSTSTFTNSTAQSTSTAFTSSTITNFGVELSGNGLAYGDAVTVNISTSGGNLGIIAASETYSSCLVAFQDYGAPSTTVTNGLAVGPNSVVTESLGSSSYELRTR
jgi:hypothetical protein